VTTEEFVKKTRGESGPLSWGGGEEMGKRELQRPGVESGHGKNNGRKSGGRRPMDGERGQMVVDLATGLFPVRAGGHGGED